MLRYFTPVMTLFALGFLAACETVEGAGEDIQTAGQEISQAAEESEE